MLSLSRNLVARLFRICKIRWRCSLLPFVASFLQKINLGFCSYLINLPAIYSQKLVASFFFLFRLKAKRFKSQQLVCKELVPHFDLPGYRCWSPTVKFSFKP